MRIISIHTPRRDSRNAFDKLTGDITNQINGQFAAAGRDLSGLNQQALARGLTQGAGQLIQNQYNQNVADQLDAINSLYGAGNTTAGLFSTLDQARLGNMKAGIGAADAANAAQMWGPTQMLAIEAQRRGIPLQTLAAQYGMVLPAAQAFATRTGATSGSESGTSSAYGSSSGTAAGTSSGQGTQNTTTSTPFNPLSLLPLAFAPLSGGASLAGMGASALGGGLFSALSNGFMGARIVPATGGYRHRMAGIFPDIFGAPRRNGVLPFGGPPVAPNPVDANRNAILGYLAGALQGGNLGQSIARGLQGWLAGAQTDATSKRSTRLRNTSRSNPTSISPSDPR